VAATAARFTCSSRLHDAPLGPEPHFLYFLGLFSFSIVTSSAYSRRLFLDTPPPHTTPLRCTGKIVNADSTVEGDVLILAGKVAAVGAGLSASAADHIPAGIRVIDAAGKYVIPAGIDPHTHMQLPFMGTVAADDFYTGTRAAVAGGTGTIIDFVIPSPDETLLQGLDKWQGWARDKVCCDYAFHMAVTHWVDGETDAEMASVVREHGITSFKHFVAYKGALMLGEAGMRKSYAAARDLGAIVTNHCENGDMVEAGQAAMKAAGILTPAGHPQSRPPAVEGAATAWVAKLAGETGVPAYVVHTTCGDAAEEIRKVRAAGQKVFGEVLAGHLVFDDSKYYCDDFDTAAGHVMSPPFRPPAHQEALWAAIGDRTIQTTATDHCAFTRAQKRMGLHDFTQIPNGCTGVEERMAVVWSKGVGEGRITPEEFVALTSANTAKIFGLYPRKGLIAPGADGDVVIWDPTAEKTWGVATHLSAIDFSVYEGHKTTGGCAVTVLRGEVVYEDGAVKEGLQGRGQYVKREAFTPHVYGEGAKLDLTIA